MYVNHFIMYKIEIGLSLRKSNHGLITLILSHLKSLLQEMLEKESLAAI